MTGNVTSVVINSAQGTIARMLLTDDQRDAMLAHWKEPDSLITRMNHLPWLTGAQSWSDVGRAEIQTLIALQITVRNDHPEHSEMIDIGLTQAILALVVNLEHDCGWVQFLRINHMSTTHVETDVSMTLGAKLVPLKPPKPAFQIIIAND